MAEGISSHSEQTGTDDDSVQAEIHAKEMITELTALGDEFRRLLDPEVTIIISLIV